MKILLDTHTALWWMNNPKKLSYTAKEILLDDDNKLHFSLVSAWEIAIKTSRGRLTEFPGGVRSFLAKIKASPITQLSLISSYIETAEDLPFIHRDPFDRLLIATALADSMTILTADENIHKYPIPTIW